MQPAEKSPVFPQTPIRAFGVDWLQVWIKMRAIGAVPSQGYVGLYGDVSCSL
jgi:hypothetical protein